MEYKDVRSRIIVCAVLSLIGGIAFDIVGTMSTNWASAMIGLLLTITGSLLILVWIVKYLHELDERLEQVEDWLEESTRGKQ